MGHTALILGDQLLRDHPALEGADRVLFVEATKTLERHRYHRKRVHLVWSAMRHFAEELRAEGREVDYRVYEPSFADALADHDEVVTAEPNAQGTRDALTRAGVGTFLPSGQFLTDPQAFATWAEGRKRLVMEDFYREQRKRFSVLLDDDGKPTGGKWNFDRDNRRPPEDGLRAPDPWFPEEDAIDAAVRRDLDAWQPGFFGADGPRRFAATPAEAQAALDDFVAHRLGGFGAWQDAMVPGQRILFHSLLSAPMNLGLLAPLDVVRAAEARYRAVGDEERIAINDAEGFIRQVLGWREFIWCMYWLRVREWPSRNALDAALPLPKAYWGTKTGWNCLDECVGDVADDAYAHHIQRLMVLGTIGLTAGIVPWQLVRWFQTAFIDGAEWVMAPNAAGMALYADGGEMMTKPYAAGGNYINRMSGYCGDCRYRPNEKQGDRACPVTALYWDFVDRHEEVLASNRRTYRAVGTWRRFGDDLKADVRDRAARAREELEGAG